MKENKEISIEYSSIEFLSSQIDVICHATEDKEKIIGSIKNILFISEDKFQEIEYEGHWGNKILKISAPLNKKESSMMVKRILEKINFTDRQTLLSNLENHIDEKGNLFLRLDKQKICRNKLFLTENEGIKIKVKPNKNKIIQQKRSNKIDNEIYNSYRRLIQFTEK
ncbi:MAG: RNA-binding domain-containing protein [Nitrososphaeraceae archaeon]